MKKILTLLFLCLFVGVTNAQIANVPNDLMLCDDDGDGIAVFDLTVTEPEILGAQDPLDFNITYYISLADVNNSTNPIVSPSVYSNILNPQTIFVRLEAISNGSFDTTNFDLIAIPPPSPATPTPLEVCDDDGDGFAAFDLNSKDIEISGGEPNTMITYHETLADAINNLNLLISPYFNTFPFLQIVYARVENITNGCFSVVELRLATLDGCPIIVLDPTDLFINEGDNDGSAIFNLTQNELQMLGSQDPTIYLFSYHEVFENSMDGVNAIVNPIAYQNIANPQTIYVRLTNSNNGSYALADFLIETDGVLSINENSLENLQFYPNPVIERIMLQSQFLTSESTVTIFNLIGTKVLSEKFVLQNGKITLDVTSLVSGVYFIKISSEENTVTKKFIKN